MSNKQKAVYMPEDISSITSYLRSKLLGHFRFDANDTVELQSIRNKIVDLMRAKENSWILWHVCNVYYETVMNRQLLTIVLIKRDAFENNSETIKLWIDFQDKNMNASESDSIASPYSIESLLKLSTEDFMQLVMRINTIKEKMTNDSRTTTI